MNASLVSRIATLFFALALPFIAAADPAVGSMAPNFKLQDQHDAWISLADQRGKWLVVYFYPMDETPGCTAEACEFRDNIFAFRKLGVNVLGISVQDVASKKEFAAKHSLPFSVLADSDKSVARSYGVLGMLGYARRETFVIDPKGRIAKHYPDVDPKTHSKQLLADLQTLVKPAT
jgi:thioredoxin-dependent peroxiredoxin